MWDLVKCVQCLALGRTPVILRVVSLSLSLCLSFSLFAPWLSCTCPCIHGRPRDVYLSSAPDIDCGHALALGKRKRPQESRSLTASRNKRSRHGRREGQQYQHEARVVNGKATLAFAALLLSSLGFHVGGDVASNHCRSCVIMKPGLTPRAVK